MRAAAMVVVLLACSAGAEEWADEKAVAAPFEPRFFPRFGPLGGVYLGAANWVNEGPVVGVRAGVRLRLVDHLAVTISAAWDWGRFSALGPGTSGFGDAGFAPRPPGTEPVWTTVALHSLNLLASVELFTTSAFEAILVPELAVSLVGGVKLMVDPPDRFQPWPPFAVVGPQFQLFRLRPSKWWFPVYLQLLFWVTDTGVQFAQFGAGLGL